MAQWNDVRNWYLCTERCQLKVLHFITNVLKSLSVSHSCHMWPASNARHKYSRFSNQFIHFINEILLSVSGQSNLTNIPISPVLAGLTLAAAILFAIVCIVLATVYRRQANRFVYPPYTNYLSFLTSITFICVNHSLLFSVFPIFALNFNRIAIHAISSISRSVEENLKSSKHTQLPAMAADCQIEQKQLQARTTTPQISGLATSMGSNCTGVSNNNDTRHHQIISDQEPPDGDETDPDVIPNQYGKCLFHQVELSISFSPKEDCLKCDDESDTESTIRFYSPRLTQL